MKKVLLHICCGPCVIYPLGVLRRDGYCVEGFFYNPNIQPSEEYERRKTALEAVKKHCAIAVQESIYELEQYREAVEGAKTKIQRCHSCFELRLKKTFEYAKAHGFDCFTTTLLVSPYQDRSTLVHIGKTLSQTTPVEFLDYDFRPGFREAHTKARSMQLYLQKYCGCLASLQEREQERKKKKNSNVCC